MDRLTPEQRHINMSRIKNKDTEIELCLRKALWERGYRYRKNYKELPGTPDVAITKHRIAIFCDSEFFHGKDWEKLKDQLSRGKNGDFWINKIMGNIEHDERINRELEVMGWKVLRFWGKDIKRNVEQCVAVVEETILDERVSEYCIDEEYKRRK